MTRIVKSTGICPYFMVDSEQEKASDTGVPSVQSWARIAPGWAALPAVERRAYLKAAARVLHEAWQTSGLPADAPLHLLAFERSNGQVLARFPSLVPLRRRAPTAQGLLDVLAEWHMQTREIVSDRDAARFLCAFFRAEQADRAGIRHAGETIARRAQSHAGEETASLYDMALWDPSDTPSDPGSRLRGRWDPEVRIRPEEFLRQVEAAETCAGADVLKENAHIRVVRAPLLGEDALIKRYDIVRWKDRIKYQVRPSRARRAWAAARTLLRLGILTPEPLGYLEIYEGRLPVRSYVVTRFMPDAVNAYRWVKQNWRQKDEAWRERFRQDLLNQLLMLYRKAIYHADTKLPNLMIENPDDEKARAFYWIDLECVQAGIVPTRHQIVRNLVQLNGSMRHWVSEADRMPFLKALARTYPWVDDPRLVERIRRWTRRRHLNELRQHCGP
jgi:hypothetical protein